MNHLTLSHELGQKMLAEMIYFATIKHHGQFDQGGNPYILHPAAVARMLADDGYDFEIQCMAWGHDLKEDCDVTDDEFRAHGQSERVIIGINALSKLEDDSIEDYERRVLSVTDAIVVKRKDLLHNSDLRRLKGKIREKDILRQARYMQLYERLTIELKHRGVFCR